jgi:hypothetical protein
MVSLQRPFAHDRSRQPSLSPAQTDHITSHFCGLAGAGGWGAKTSFRRARESPLAKFLRFPTLKDPLRKCRKTGTISRPGTDGDGAMTPFEYVAASCLVVLILWAIGAATAT